MTNLTILVVTLAGLSFLRAMLLLVYSQFLLGVGLMVRRCSSVRRSGLLVAFLLSLWVQWVFGSERFRSPP